MATLPIVNPAAAAVTDPAILPQPNNQAPPAPTTRLWHPTDVETAIAQARREEKSKLYEDLEKTRERSKVLGDKITKLEEDLANAQAGSKEALKLKDQLDALQTKYTALEGSIQTTLTTALEKQRVDTVQSMNEEFDKRDVRNYRDTLIAGAQGKVIPGLVVGNSREEVLASFTAAQAEYTRVQTEAAAAAEKAFQEKYKDALPPAVTAGTAGEQTDPATNIERIRKDRKYYEENRADIKKKAYEQAGLPMKARR